MAVRTKIGFIGCGNMAGAILDCCAYEYKVSDGKEDVCGLDYDIFVYDVDSSKTAAKVEYLANFRQKNEVNVSEIAVCKSITELVKAADYIVLGIKPNIYKEVLTDICDSLTKDKILISIMAGVTVESIKKIVPCKVVRTMPNLPITIGGGMTAIVKNSLKNDDKRVIEDIFTRSGFFIYVDEAQMDAVTAISGSGPAYVFKFIDGMVKAGMKLGLSYSQALNLSNQTVAAAAGMTMTLEHENKTLGKLIGDVCSKGGTTERAINVFTEDGLEELIEKAVFAAYNRSKVMSND